MTTCQGGLSQVATAEILGTVTDTSGAVVPTATIAANGQSYRSNNFLIDGLENNERSIGKIVVKPSMDAIDEVGVETNLLSAEICRSGAPW